MDPPRDSLQCRIIYQLETFEEIELFHVLRPQNKKADEMANVGATLPEGNLLVNRESMGNYPIP